MESFWQGMTIEEVKRDGEDLIFRGESIEFPLAQEFILERDKSDYSKDIKLNRDEVTEQYLRENMPDRYVLLGLNYNAARKRCEVIQIASPDGWCWDEI